MASSKYMLSDDTGLPKWKIALALGGAAVLGAGLYYTLYAGSEVTKKGDKKIVSDDGSKISKSSNGVTAPTVTEIDNTPLGKAKMQKTCGNSLFRAGQYEEAIKCYDQAIASCPKEAANDLSTFYQNRAAAYEHKKDWSAVLRDCTAALELNPRYAKALVRRARAAEVLQDLNLALQDYTAICITETFSNQDSLNVVDRILKQIGMAHAKELFGKRRERLPSKHTIRSYLNNFCCDPIYNKEDEEVENLSALKDGYLRALHYLRAERYELIIPSCDSELQNPTSAYRVHALLLRGVMHALYMDGEAATKDFTAVADSDSAPTKFRVAALVKLGLLEMTFNRNEEAMAAYNKALNMDPDNADVHHQRGQTFLLMNDIESAMESFNKAVELNPNFPIGLVQKLHTDYRYAVFKGDRAQQKKVLPLFKQARDKFPKCPEVYLLLAQILMDEEDYSGAEQQFTQLLAVQPNNPAALVYRGMLSLQWQNDIEASKDQMKRALAVDDQCEMALENLATISVQTGDLHEGVKLFNRAIPLAKTINEMAHYCSLRDAAVAQIEVVQRLGITLPGADH